MKKDRYILTPEQYHQLNEWVMERLLDLSSGWSFFVSDFFRGKRDQVQTRIRRELISLVYREWEYAIEKGGSIAIRENIHTKSGKCWKPLPYTMIARMFGVRHSAVIAALKKNKRESRNK